MEHGITPPEPTGPIFVGKAYDAEEGWKHLKKDMAISNHIKSLVETKKEPYRIKKLSTLHKELINDPEYSHWVSTIENAIDEAGGGWAEFNEQVLSIQKEIDAAQKKKDKAALLHWKKEVSKLNNIFSGEYVEKAFNNLLTAIDAALEMLESARGEGKGLQEHTWDELRADVGYKSISPRAFQNRVKSSKFWNKKVFPVGNGERTRKIKYKPSFVSTLQDDFIKNPPNKSKIK